MLDSEQMSDSNVSRTDRSGYDWRVVVIRHKMDGDTRKVIKCGSHREAISVARSQLAMGHPAPVIERRPKIHQMQWKVVSGD